MNEKYDLWNWFLFTKKKFPSRIVVRMKEKVWLTSWLEKMQNYKIKKKKLYIER